MAKGYVKLRRGIVDHFPDLSDGEIRLFIAMLARARSVGPLAGTVYGSTTDLMERAGFTRRETFLNARRALEKRGWISRVGAAANQHGQSSYRIAKFGSAGSPSGPAKAVENDDESLENSPQAEENSVENSPGFPQDRTSGGPAADQRRTSGGPATPPSPNNLQELQAPKTLETLETLKPLKNASVAPLDQIRILPELIRRLGLNNPAAPQYLEKLKAWAADPDEQIRTAAQQALAQLQAA